VHRRELRPARRGAEDGHAHRHHDAPEVPVNRPVDDWGKLLGDTAAVTALLDRLPHHGHVLKCGPRSWRTKGQADLRQEQATK